MSIASDHHPRLCECMWCMAHGRSAVAALSSESSLAAALGSYREDGSLKFSASVLVAPDADAHDVADWLVGFAAELRRDNPHR